MIIMLFHVCVREAHTAMQNATCSVYRCKDFYAFYYNTSRMYKCYSIYCSCFRSPLYANHSDTGFATNRNPLIGNKHINGIFIDVWCAVCPFASLFYFISYFSFFTIEYVFSMFSCGLPATSLSNRPPPTVDKCDQANQSLTTPFP